MFMNFVSCVEQEFSRLKIRSASPSCGECGKTARPWTTTNWVAPYVSTTKRVSSRKRTTQNVLSTNFAQRTCEKRFNFGSTWESQFCGVLLPKTRESAWTDESSFTPARERGNRASVSLQSVEAAGARASAWRREQTTHVAPTTQIYEHRHKFNLWPTNWW